MQLPPKLFGSDSSVEALIQTLSNLKAYVYEVERSLNLFKHDVRSVALKNIGSNVGYVLMVYNLIGNWLGDSQKLIPKILGISPPSDENIQAALNRFEQSTRFGLVLSVQFLIEHCVRETGSYCGYSVKRKGFFPLAEALLNHLDLLKSGAAEMNVLAEIRNSFHSNGFHHGYKDRDSLITVNGVEYNFKHGEPVTCASLLHICHATANSIFILSQCFQSPKLKGVRIEDAFSKLMEGTNESK